MRKSKLVANVMAAVCLGAAAIFVGMLLVLLLIKGPSWSKVGKIPGTNTRIDSEFDLDTSTISDLTYYNYIHGYYDDNPERAATLAEQDYVTLIRDEEGNIIKAWIEPFEKAAPFLPDFFLSIYSGKNWCLQPAARAARYTSWMIIFLLVAIGALPVWRFAFKISQKPLKRSGRSGRGQKVYRGNIFQRFGRWVRGLRGGNGRKPSRGRGRR